MTQGQVPECDHFQAGHLAAYGNLRREEWGGELATMSRCYFSGQGGHLSWVLAPALVGPRSIALHKQGAQKNQHLPVSAAQTALAVLFPGVGVST